MILNRDAFLRALMRRYTEMRMKTIIQALLLSTLLSLGGCLATAPTKQQIRIDEVPMYGGIERLEIDRSKNPELRAGDEKFITDVTKHYGSRENAARAWVEQGYKFYQQGYLGMAMRRFNQAWLLDASNPEVYTGFAAVLHDQGKSCEALQMIDKALTLNPPTYQGIYPDAARIITLCAVSDNTLSSQAKSELIARSEALYKKAEEIEPSKHYVYGSWATAYYWRGQYREAWTMVAKERAAGGKPGEKFLTRLREKMPEPAP
jgi:tetratricopeptide (TPR) repeat protein